jgi:cytoskeletal protein RodZ
MEKKIEINGIKFDVSTIENVYIESVEYIFVPKYLKDNSLKNKVTHNVYQFLNMEPYGLFNSEIDLDSIDYIVENLNGYIENEESGVICKQTKEYKYIETSMVDCLVICADKEYRFYGSGIDCANANILYNKVKLLLKGMNNSNSTVSSLTDAINKTSTSVGKFSKRIGKLSMEKKVILAAIAIFVFFFIVISIGASNEEKENFTTTINRTTELTTTYEYIDESESEDTTTSDYEEIETDEFITEEKTTETTTKETTTKETTTKETTTKETTTKETTTKETTTKETTTKETTTKEVTTTTEEYIEEISIYNVSGVLIHKEIDFNNKSIDVSEIVSGVYFIKIKTENETFVQKFIKE